MPIPHRTVSLSAATTGTGTAADMGNYDSVSVAFVGSGTISAGAVIIEEADTQGYTGTWSAIQTVSVAALTGGAAQVVHLARAQYAWVRARVTSTVTGGGSITVSIRGQL